MNNSPNKARRLAFVLSGTVDAFLGGLLLLLGLGFLPVDATSYGFENWHTILLGGILFFTGLWFVTRNLSRWEE